MALPANPGVSLIWTPIAPPLDSSTALPADPPSEIPYIGVPLSPLLTGIDPLPISPPELHGLITVFPVDSGVAPLFTVYSKPYDDATGTGAYSGRPYNPESAGEPTQDLEWRDVRFGREGVENVKLHIGRMEYSAANDVMINRLEKILSGEIKPTDTDRRFYTHELRELERYRMVGIGDDVKSESMDQAVWNNLYTATLEDFKLKDDERLLYTNEALAAADKQMNEFYKAFLKGGS